MLSFRRWQKTVLIEALNPDVELPWAKTTRNSGWKARCRNRANGGAN